MINYSEKIKAYLELEMDIIKNLDVDSINHAMNEILSSFENETKIYIFGNGGSAATASHFANDFNKGISEYTEKKFNFVCLNDNIPTFTAIANDIGYDSIFEFQLKGRLKKNDVIVAISGSGNSKNVLLAVNYAKSIGAKIIGVTGYDGGKLKQISDISLHVPVNSMQITEDIHMIFDHLMMSIFYKELANKEHLKK